MAADLFILPGTLREKAYREAYNETSLLLHLGLSWITDIKPLMKSNYTISFSNIKKIRELILSKDIPEVDQLNNFKPNKEYIRVQEVVKEAILRGEILGAEAQVVDPKGPKGSKKASLDERHEQLIKDREELLGFLQYAIDNRFEIWTSL